MKKVLLASTVLAFSAGAAAAEIALTGDANMGVKFIEGAADEIQLHYEVDFGVVGSGETDSGLSFGASIDLDQEIDSATGNEDAAADSGPSDPEVFVSGAFGTLTVGSVDVATDGFGIADLGFDGLGVDDVAERFRVQGAANVAYNYSFGDFGVIVTFHTVDEDYAIAATYDGGSFNVGVGYAVDESASTAAITLDAGATFGAFGVNAIVTDSDAAAQGLAYGVDVSYKLASTTITAAYADNDAASDPAIGIGASYSLGGGATLAGGIGQVGGNLRADFGIGLKF